MIFKIPCNNFFVFMNFKLFLSNSDTFHNGEAGKAIQDRIKGPCHQKQTKETSPRKGDFDGVFTKSHFVGKLIPIFTFVTSRKGCKVSRRNRKILSMKYVIQSIHGHILSRLRLGSKRFNSQVFGIETQLGFRNGVSAAFFDFRFQNSRN